MQNLNALVRVEIMSLIDHVNSAGCGKLSGDLPDKCLNEFRQDCRRFSPEREATRGTTCGHVWSEVASDPCVAGLVPVCR